MSAIKLPARNLKVLNQALRAMLRHPTAVDMRKWIGHRPERGGQEPYCGTTACLAGFIAIVATGKIGDTPRYNGGEPGDGGPEPDFYYRADLPKSLGKVRSVSGVSDVTDSQEIARCVLGLRNEEGGQLFYLAEWPEKFRKQYRKKGERARATVARVRHWLRTGE